MAKGTLSGRLSGGRLVPAAAVAVVSLCVVVTVLALTPLGVVGALVVGVLLVQGVLALGLVLLRREQLRTREAMEAAHGVLATAQARQLRVTRRLRRRLDRTHQRRRQQLRQLNRSAQQRHSRQQVRQERMHTATQRQVQALLVLDRMVQVDRAVPPMGAWAASPDLIELCVQELLDRRPATVVECGSGLSTLYLALAAEQYDLPCRIIALEHEERFAEATRRVLERHRVLHRAEVRHAPLREGVLAGHTPGWYDPQAVADLEQIGMLLVDGPPGDGGHHARFPALPLLYDRLAPECLVVMDDLNRTSDREVAERWAALYPDFTLDVDTQLQKYVGLLRRTHEAG